MPQAKTRSLPSAGDVADDHLLGSARRQIAVSVGKADHRVGVGDVDPARLRARRIKGDAEVAAQAGGEQRAHLRLAVAIGVAQDLHLPRPRLGHEHVAVWRGDDDARVFQIGGVLLDREAARRFGPGSLRASNDARPVVHRGRVIGSGQIGDGDAPPHAGRVGGPVAQRRPAGQRLPRVLCGSGGGAERVARSRHQRGDANSRREKMFFFHHC